MEETITLDTPDDVLVDVLDCIDADSEQAEEYKPLIGEVRDATDAAVKAAKRAESGEDERVAAEAERVAAESARNQAETERVAEEKARAVAEQRRVTAETDRERDFAKFKAAALAAAALALPAAVSAAADTKTAIADAGAKVDAAVDRVNDAANQAVTKAEAATATADAANVAAWKSVTDAQATIAEVKATEAKLYPVAENVLVGSETGTSVHVDDAFAGAALRVITVEGACRQDGTPSPDNPVPIQVIEHPVVKVTGRNPYASQSLAFTLPAEHPYLAKLPDGTADEIVVDREGNVELVARVGRDDNVRNVKYISVGKFYELSVKLPAFANAASLTSTSALCSAIQSLSYNTTGIYRTWTGVYVKDTTGHTKEEIQAVVDKNAPLTVFAPIPETRYQLGKIEMPKAQDSIVNAWTDAEVTPNTSIEYVRDVNIVVANLETAIASITEG